MLLCTHFGRGADLRCIKKEKYMEKTEKEKLIDEFIEKLSEIEDSNDFDNPWKDPDKCENLKKFLKRKNNLRKYYFFRL